MSPQDKTEGKTDLTPDVQPEATLTAQAAESAEGKIELAPDVQPEVAPAAQGSTKPKNPMVAGGSPSAEQSSTEMSLELFWKKQAQRPKVPRQRRSKEVKPSYRTLQQAIDLKKNTSAGTAEAEAAPTALTQ